MALSSSHQSRDEGAEEGFASVPGVVHEPEEAEVDRQPCGSAASLRDAPVRAEPGAQQGPRPLHGVDVDPAKAVAVLVARVLPATLVARVLPAALVARVLPATVADG